MFDELESDGLLGELGVDGLLGELGVDGLLGELGVDGLLGSAGELGVDGLLGLLGEVLDELLVDSILVLELLDVLRILELDSELEMFVDPLIEFELVEVLPNEHPANDIKVTKVNIVFIFLLIIIPPIQKYKNVTFFQFTTILCNIAILLPVFIFIRYKYKGFVNFY